MWSVIGSLLASVVSGVVQPLVGYLSKRQDVTLDGFRTASGVDLEAYKAALAHEEAMAHVRLAANGWWGAKLLYMIVGLAAAAHTAAIFIDSTLTFGVGRYGNLGVPPLPAPYDEFERTVILSLFVVSAVGALPSAAAAWLRKK